jgi:hypothetical protein
MYNNTTWYDGIITTKTLQPLLNNQVNYDSIVNIHEPSFFDSHDKPFILD